MSMIVTPEKVAARAGFTGSITDLYEELVDFILDAQADVEAHLRRSIVRSERVVNGETPYDTTNLSDVAVWPAAAVLSMEDDVEVKSWALQPDGTYTVTFYVGLDGAEVRPILRYVTEHAAAMFKAKAMPQDRTVRSVSAEGQSISWEGTPTSGPGAPPTLDSLNHWRRYSSAFHPSRRATQPVWPG